MTTHTPPRKRIGIALGSGSARGLAHIGILRALGDMGIEPDIVCGSSMGALVGAAYVSDHLDMFEKWVRGLTSRDIVRYLDIKLVVGGGFAEARRLLDFFRGEIGDVDIEDLPKPYAAVATDLDSGREVWVRTGPLWDAVRSSIAIPGILTPAQIDHRWMLDGGLVNPVPVSLCRALDAEIVIAVNLNSDITLRGQQRRKVKSAHDQDDESTEQKLLEQLANGLKARAGALISPLSSAEPDRPGLFDVLAGSLNIMQDRITRSRMAGDPPDIILSPRLPHIGLLEFDRAAEAIDEGRACVKRMRPAIQDALERSAADD